MIIHLEKRQAGQVGISRDIPVQVFENGIQPVVKPNRKCCVNGKVESGALKISFLGSESLLHRVVQERWNT